MFAIVRRLRPRIKLRQRGPKLRLRRNTHQKGSQQWHSAKTISARTGESPGVRGSAPVLRPMSTHSALPLLVSVGRPGPPKPAVSRTAPQGRAQRSLTLPAIIFDPTDGGRDLQRRGPKGAAEVAKGVQHHAVFYSQITSPNTRRFTQPLTVWKGFCQGGLALRFSGHVSPLGR
jgi:hypothetical protein